MSKDIKHKTKKCLYESDTEYDSVLYKELAKYFPSYYWCFVLYGTIGNLIISAIIAIVTRELSTTLLYLVLIETFVMVHYKVKLPIILEREFSKEIDKGTKEPISHNEFYIDYFTKENKDQILKVYYNEITKSIETESYFHLLSKSKNTVVSIQKSSCNLELINFVREKVTNIQNHLGESSEFKGAKKYHNPKFIKGFMLVLFIMTLFSFFGVSYTFELVDRINPHHGCYSFADLWIFLIWLVFPILSIILGYKYDKAGFKCTKNIVSGLIVGFILILFGLLSVLTEPFHSENYNMINDFKSIINASIPSDGKIHTMNLSEYSFDGITNYSIISVYYDRQDVTEMTDSIESCDTWILSTELKSELKIMLPQMIKSSGDGIYYSIYNKTTNEYNTLPKESGVYEIYSMHFDKKAKQLSIHRYQYDYKK